MNFSKTINLLPNDFPVKIFADRDLRVTGADLRRRSALYAAWLQSRGYKTIGIHMGNCPEFFYLFAGAMRAGVKVRLFNALREAHGDMPIFDRNSAAKIALEFSDGCGTFREYDWGIDEPLLEMSTSGTNGNPKIVEKSIENYFGRSNALRLWRFSLGAVRPYVYNCSPWYHNTGVYLLLLPICGAKLSEITAEKFNPNTMRLYINDICPEAILTTPTMLLRCILSGDVRLPPYIICTGEALSAEMLARFESCGSGQVLYSAYGSTEVSALARMLYTFNSIRLPGRIAVGILRLSGLTNRIFDKNTLEPNCVGSLAKNAEVKIMNDGREAEDGTLGEVWVKTPLMLREIGNQFFYTGDIGYKRGNMLYICGRSLNVINRSGEKIVPSDIERVIYRFEGVQAVTVFGVPSATHGEDICVVVESKDGAPVVDKTTLSEMLPKYMLPQHILFLDAFPLNASGKKDLAAIRRYAFREIGASAEPSAR